MTMTAFPTRGGASGTDPKNQDSDDDGLLDKEELDLGCDPLIQIPTMMV